VEVVVTAVMRFTMSITSVIALVAAPVTAIQKQLLYLVARVAVNMVQAQVVHFGLTVAQAEALQVD